MKESFINAMVTAIEGGSTFWCKEIGFYDASGKQVSLEDWFTHGDTIQVFDGEEKHIETHEAFFAHQKRYFPDWVEVFNGENDYDAGDADDFLQFGVFGERIF